MLIPKSSLLSRSKDSLDSQLLSTTGRFNCGDTMHHQFSPYDRVSRCASHPDIYHRSWLNSLAFSLGFPPGTRSLNGTTRRWEKLQYENVIATTTDPRIVFPVEVSVSEDTIAIKSPVLSRAGFSSRMSGELLQADGTL